MVQRLIALVSDKINAAYEHESTRTAAHFQALKDIYHEDGLVLSAVYDFMTTLVDTSAFCDMVKSFWHVDYSEFREAVTERDNIYLSS